MSDEYEIVTLYHPETKAYYDAPVLAVPALKNSGWVPADEAPKAEEGASVAPQPPVDVPVTPASEPDGSSTEEH